MRLVSLLCIATALAACGGGGAAKVTPPADEDCAKPGDEDGNGLADCMDPVCASTVACRALCGNGRMDGGEVCDDGNAINGDGCDSNCTPSACGNGITAAGEACDDGNQTNGDGCDNNCTATACGNGVMAAGEACDDGNRVNGDGCENTCKLTLGARSYIKASNTNGGDGAGFRVALSADGSTLAISAANESSAATGVDGDQADNAAGSSGAVYVFIRAGETWTQQAYIKASNTGAGDHFGDSLALSGDGSTMVVGAPHESSAATGIGGDQNNNAAEAAGAVYVFTRTGTTWSQQAYLKASNAEARDQFGFSIALSRDGSVLAVGATGEAGGATGPDADQADNSADAAGAVYVFTRDDATWTQDSYLKASNAEEGDGFGTSLALSSDGLTLAVGAVGEDSSASGIGGDEKDNIFAESGAVYVFARGDTAWTQQAYVKSAATHESDLLGHSVALSSDGSLLAAGAVGDSAFAGAVTVFARSAGTWTQQARLTASNADPQDEFASSLALSSDGSTLAVGAFEEASAALGINGDQTNNTARLAGAVYVFTRTGDAWSQQRYVKAPNSGTGDEFGWSVALSGDGLLMAVGAPLESSGATGIDGDQGDDANAQGAGAVYVY